MTLRFMDSYDHYTTNAQMAQKYTVVDASFAPVAAVGRNSTAGLRNSDVGGGDGKTFNKVFDNQNKWTCGIAVNISTAFLANTFFISFKDGTTTQVGVYLNADGTLSVRRGGTGGTILATSTSALSLGAWYFVELQAVIHGSTGTYEVRVNGTSSGWCSGSGANTSQSGNAYANAVENCVRRNSLMTVDDLYLCDGQGSTNNSFLGDIRVSAIFPNAAGAYSQWASFPSGANYTVVDETTPNNDTDFVATSGAGYQDTYGFTNLPVASGTVLGVQALPFARKDDAGSRSLSSLIYYNSTVYSGSPNSVGDTYAYYPTIWETNPDTSARWTVSEVNNAEFGLRLVS